jgi:hypothetical protein
MGKGKRGNVSLINAKKVFEMQDEHANALSQVKTETLEIEASLREQELKVEVLRRDKTLLLEELNKSKETQSSIIKLWEGMVTFLNI